jgi:hypothetical protein
MSPDEARTQQQDRKDQFMPSNAALAAPVFHGGGIVLDEAFKAAAAATLCSIGIFLVLCLLMLSLPVNIG